MFAGIEIAARRNWLVRPYNSWLGKFLGQKIRPLSKMYSHLPNLQLPVTRDTHFLIPNPQSPVPSPQPLASIL